MLIILIPLIILQALNIYNNFQSMAEQKLQSSVELADAVSKSFVNYIDQLWVNESIIISHITDNIDNTEKIQSFLQNIVTTNKNAVQRLSWLTPDGMIVASSREYMIGKSLAKRQHYQRILTGEDHVMSDLIESYGDGDLVIPVASAVRKDGKLLGILVSSIDSDNLISHIPNLKLNDGDRLELIDGSGNIVYDSLNNTLSMKERKVPINSTILKALNGQVIKFYKSKTTHDNSVKMGVASPISEFGWVCLVTSERRIVLKDIYRQAVQSVFILIFVSIISLTIAFILGKQIAVPLLLLKNKATQLKEGDYSVRTNITGYDEIAATAEAFDLMADSIEQFDQLKSQFISNLSHEFKTPINVIYSTIQLIESLQDSNGYNDFKNKTLKSMKGIRQNCYRLMRLVDNMIDVTRYDAGHLKFNPYKIDIISVIENISLSVVKFTEHKSVTIIFDTEVEEKEFYCDPYMIERIVLNLISNSLKFTDEGGFIYVNLYDREDKVIISVRDTGIGIPEDKLSIIFDRFRQVDTSLNRNHEGSGLGLSIVKALVDAHKGSIAVNSAIGIGTEFVIELPSIVNCEETKENDKPLFDSRSHTIQKIEIEFSDIYS
jgi:signal transduction histidine kinase